MAYNEKATRGASDRGAQVLPPAGATVPPWLPAKSARASNLPACCALGPPSAVPSNSNFPASHFEFAARLIAQSYRAFSSPSLGRPTRLPGRALFCRRRHQPRRPALAKRRLLLAQYSFNSLHNWHFEILFIVAIIIQLIHIVLEAL
jgi:hypothetical protein